MNITRRALFKHIAGAAALAAMPAVYVKNKISSICDGLQIDYINKTVKWNPNHKEKYTALEMYQYLAKELDAQEQAMFLDIKGPPMPVNRIT